MDRLELQVIQLFVIFWGTVNSLLYYKVLIAKKDSDELSFEESLDFLSRFVSIEYIKIVFVVIMSILLLINISGYLLCYAYIEFTIMLKIIYGATVVLTVGGSLLFIAVIVSEMDNYINQNMNMIDMRKGEGKTEEDVELKKDIQRVVESVLSFFLKTTFASNIVLALILFIELVKYN